MGGWTARTLPRTWAVHRKHSRNGPARGSVRKRSDSAVGSSTSSPIWMRGSHCKGIPRRGKLSVDRHGGNSCTCPHRPFSNKPTDLERRARIGRNREVYRLRTTIELPTDCPDSTKQGLWAEKLAAAKRPLQPTKTTLSCTMNAETIAGAFRGYQWNVGWTARCPAHDQRDGGEK
jgi:hypothetical protein